jgi:hypothetical protein
VIYPQLDNHGSSKYSVTLTDDQEKIALLALKNAAGNQLDPQQLIDLYELTKDLQRIGFGSQTGPKHPHNIFPWRENVSNIVNFLTF